LEREKEKKILGNRKEVAKKKSNLAASHPSLKGQSVG